MDPIDYIRDGVDLKSLSDVPAYSVHNEEKEGKSRFIASSYLKIRPLVQDDGAKFACEAFHKALDHRMRNEVTLSVLHPPGPPRIEGYEEGNIVKAGEALTLLCISEGGNPPPQLIWYRSNVQIDSTYYQILGETATANNLTFIVSAADNTGSYHCKTSNAATKEPLTASIKLSVYYKLLIPRHEGWKSQAQHGRTSSKSE
ncbi:Synaptogenesis protein syg-2 [Araneus ventricosus]|uniref:Synaptogenesis protein syg-2 n=1 Tax=Araneus ventricosus TaxID=182803 RepID=A0A4Y2IKX2_ARAVE|nr:Synaptogenesis protein syg-2 [Araneus ventricosus]